MCIAKKICQYGLLALLFGAGVFDFFLFIGEESPAYEFSTAPFILLKVAAFCLLLVIIRVGKWLLKKGLLPERFVKSMSDLKEEEV